MSLSEQCSILLLSKDRPKYLQRFLTFGRINYSLSTVIADGSTQPLYRIVDEIRDDKVHYKYVVPDLKIKDFVRKVILGLESVQTKYVILMDDDDFLSEIAIEKAINFLETNEGYIAYIGFALDFSLSIKQNDLVYGTVANARKRALAVTFCEDDVSARVSKYIDIKGSYWHGVIRTAELLKVWKIIEECDPQRYESVEVLLNIILLSLGRCHSASDALTLYHQVHNNMISKSLKNDYELSRDENWIAEIEMCLKVIEKQGMLASSPISAKFKKVWFAFQENEKKRVKPSSYIFDTLRRLNYAVRSRLDWEPKLKVSALELPTNQVREFNQITYFLSANKV
jgi:glycosyltransferase domain-containing protein